MKLPKDSPLYTNLPELNQTLPDLAELQQLGGSAYLRSTLTAKYAFQDSQNFQLAGQILIGNLVSNVGAPLVMFNAMTKALSFNVQQAAIATLEQGFSSLQNAFDAMTEDDGVIDKAVNAGIGTTINLSAVVPVVGWIVKAAWNIGKAIYDIVQLVKQSQKEFEQRYPPSRFSPDADLAAVNDGIISLVRASRDWTQLFYPPGVGKAHSWQKPFGYQPLGDENHKIGTRIVTTNPSPTWLGFVPGTDFLHQSIEVLNHLVTEAGTTLLPSARKQCIWMWRHISEANVPSAFTVDAEVCAALWQTYVEDLRVYLNETDVLNSSDKKQTFAFYNGNPGAAGWGKIFGWGDGSKEMEYGPTQICNKLRDRQFDLLDTITCAYVNESFGAIKSNAALKDRWKQRRQQLLEHPAVCTVDEDNIPDEDYRAEVISRRSHYQCMLGAYDFAATPKARFPTVVPQGFPSLSSGSTPPPSTRSYKPLVIGGGLAALAYWQRDAIMKFLGGLKR